jgi:hypothetical protein
MGALVDLVLSALVGIVPDSPRWAKWLVIALYVAVAALGVWLIVAALT